MLILMFLVLGRTALVKCLTLNRSSNNTSRSRYTYSSNDSSTPVTAAAILTGDDFVLLLLLLPQNSIARLSYGLHSFTAVQQQQYQPNVDHSNSSVKVG